MKYILPVTLLIILLINACNTPCDSHLSRLHLVRSDSTIRIPIGDQEVPTSRNIRRFVDNGREYLAVENSNLNKIDVYDLQELSFDKSIKLFKEGPNGIGRMSGFDMINYDSIFVCSRGYGFQVCLIDSSSLLKKRYKIEENFSPYFSFEDFWSSYGTGVYKLAGGLFLNNQFRDEMEYFDNHFQEYSIGYWNDGVDEKCVNYKVKYPDMRKCSSKVFMPENNVIFCGTTPIINFQFGHQIFVWKDSIWREYMVESKFFKTRLSALSQSASSINAIEKNYAESPCYPVLMYDSYRNVYYRFAYPGIDVKADDDMMGMAEFRSLFSIIVLDNNFNVLDEVLLPENTYNNNMFFINQSGLWISTNHIRNPKFEENAINFELYELK